MFEDFTELRTVTKTQTNVRLLLDDPESKGLRFTRLVNVIVEGTMEVFTQESFFIRTEDVGETFVLPWWIGEMPSVGRSSLGEIRMHGNPNLRSNGVIRQSAPGSAFPAILEAAVYQVFEIPGYGTLYNEYPVMIDAIVDEIPPFGVSAKCAKGAILLDESGVSRGVVGGRSLTLLGPA